MDVEAAAPGAAEFEPTPSVYARNNNNPESVRGAFQVGLTAPPRLPTPAAPNDADLLFLNRLPRRQSSHLVQSASKTLP